jgi:hypothetical protein
MYIAIRRYELDPANMDEVTRIIREGFVPIVSSTPGFQAYDWIRVEPGVGLSINVFADKEGAEASIAEAAEFVRAHLAPHLPTPPQITEGEVLVHQGR